VCKPIGPLCPTYATCNPRLRATARVPLTLDDRFRIRPSRADVTVEEGCTVGGLDMTSKVTDVAARQKKQVQAQIDGAVPDVGALAAEGWAALQRPVPWAGVGCVAVTPRHVVQAAPREVAGALVLRFAVRGELEMSTRCDEPAGGVAPLPRLEQANELPAAGAVRLPMQLGLERVAHALEATLADRGVTAVRARGVRVEGGAAVALALTLEGAGCGTAWLLAELAVRDDTNTLGVTRARVAPGQDPAVAGAVADIVAALESAPSILSLPEVEEAKRGAKDSLARATSSFGGAIDASVLADPPRAALAAVAVDHVLVTVSASGKVTLRLRDGGPPPRKAKP
jgi:hypothetical protein